MTEQRPIDQVMVRRLGGWNLISLAAWSELGADERVSLLQQGAVRFLADGEVVPRQEALAALGVDRPATAGRVPPSFAAGARLLSWPRPGQCVSNAIYARIVVDGPRWEVFRRDERGQVIPLAEARGWGDHDPYDLRSDHGLMRLAHDLIGDCLGLGTEILEYVGQLAVAHFAGVTIPAELGDGRWHVTGEQLRKLLAVNPYLIFTPPS